MGTSILNCFLPEAVLAFFTLFQLLLNARVITNDKYNFPKIINEICFQCFFVLLCCLYLYLNDYIEGFFVNFLFLNDSSSKLLKILIVIVCIVILLSIVKSFETQELTFFEFFIIFLMTILSSLLLVSTSDMLSMYLVIEMQALSFYILSCFKRNSAFSTEAAIKYFILGSLISGVYLLGCSTIYGILGTLNFNNLSVLFSFPLFEDSTGAYQLLLISLVIITCTFLFKSLAAPFQFWIPDIYEGSPLGSTIIFSILPKLSIMYIFLKWILVINIFNEIKILLIISGILSIFFGSFYALNQKRLKRLIINSSNAQIGFLILALSINSLNSDISLFYFLTIYLITSSLIWIILSLFYNFQDKINLFLGIYSFPLYLSSISALFSTNKQWSFSNIIIFFSLAGIPPFVGFFAKIIVLASIIEADNVITSFFLIMISAVSVFYYIRIIKTVFFEKNLINNVHSSQVIFKDNSFIYDCLIMSFLLFLLILLFIYPSFFLLLNNFIISSFYFF